MCHKTKLRLFLLISQLFFQAQALYDRVYYLDTSLSGKVPSTITPVTVRSLTDCGNKCTSFYGCVGFYFSLLDHGCFLDTASTYHVTFTANLFTEHFISSVPGPSPSSRRLSASLSAGSLDEPHSRSINASTASMTSRISPAATTNSPLTSPMSRNLNTALTRSSIPSTVSLSKPRTSTSSTQKTSTILTPTSSSHVGIAIVSNSACPSKFEKDVIVQGLSGLTYRLKIIDINETKNSAEIKCATYGMHLLKVNNNVKVHDLSKFLNGCNVYQGLEYWTDAAMSTNSWTNSDGSIVPKSAWCHGTPGRDAGQRCARLKPGCGFKLIDCPCQSNIWKFAVICE